ncbi:IS110 family transposase, partial [Streptomyces minutiscleroticus]|uniref:IS110 family transposase n=1 Tax=Streptomyces minutiscleroticus TaxID=68238 RepID=UPI003333910B
MTAHGPARQAPRKAAHATDVVLGVDTHKDVHVATVLTTLGALLATGSFPTTQAGYVDLLARARSFGTVRQAGVEGTGSYGASLCRYLLAEGVQVIEVNRPVRRTDPGGVLSGHGLLRRTRRAPRRVPGR